MMGGGAGVVVKAFCFVLGSGNTAVAKVMLVDTEVFVGAVVKGKKCGVYVNV